MPGITFKIHQGTGRSTGENLCRSCSYANYMTDSKGERFRCVANTVMQPRGIVITCKSYNNAGLTDISAMYATPWILKPSKDPNKPIGFAPPKPSNYDDD